jgi:hypothetical protein
MKREELTLSYSVLIANKWLLTVSPQRVSLLLKFFFFSNLIFYFRFSFSSTIRFYSFLALSNITIMTSFTVMVLKSMGSHPAFRAYNFIPFFCITLYHSSV